MCIMYIVHFVSKQLDENNDSLDFMTFSTCLSFRKYLIMIYHNYVIISHKKEMHIQCLIVLICASWVEINFTVNSNVIFMHLHFHEIFECFIHTDS